MVKQDIENLIYSSTKVQVVLKQTKSPQLTNLNLYEYSCLMGDDETANQESISFYVLNEGAENEKAYWRPGMKDKLYPTPTSGSVA